MIREADGKFIHHGSLFYVGYHSGVSLSRGSVKLPGDFHINHDEIDDVIATLQDLKTSVCTGGDVQSDWRNR